MYHQPMLKFKEYLIFQRFSLTEKEYYIMGIYLWQVKSNHCRIIVLLLMYMYLFDNNKTFDVISCLLFPVHTGRYIDTFVCLFIIFNINLLFLFYAHCRCLRRRAVNVKWNISTVWREG